jgi:curli biogenesis system outer membrane secretion channel CsgG
MKKALFLALAALLIFGTLSAEAAKPRVAVTDFEIGVDNAPSNIGSGIADMLTTALVKSGKVDVYERAKLQAILGEQGLSMSGMVDPNAAIKMGKLLGVQYIITGKLTEYGVSESGSDIGSFSFKNTEARVAADCRMIDTTTGRILLADTGVGTESQGGISESSNNVAIGMEGYDSSIIGKATRKAIEDMVAKTIANIQLEGRVLTVSGTVVRVNLGKDQTKVGDLFEVLRMGEPIKDPDTGEVLDVETVKVGKIQITKTLPKLSEASIVTGTKIQKGDLVRPAPPEN